MEINGLYILPANTFVFSVKLQCNVSFEFDLFVKVSKIGSVNVECIAQEEYFNPFNMNIFNYYLTKTHPSFKNNINIDNLLVNPLLLTKI
jgi:hypothetical protein